MPSNVPIPLIRYDAGAGTVNVNPTYPNVKKPKAVDFEAVRHDSITSSGLRQSITERVDRVFEVNFNFVPWEDLTMWSEFFAYAVEGGPFAYYPDGTTTTYNTWQLVDDKVKFTYVSKGLSSFKFSMRLVPGGPSSA